MSDAMKVKSLTNWYGSARMIASEVGRQLAGCSWVGIPCAGGMSEIPYIDARSLLVGDLHRHLINLARVVGHPTLGPALYRRLRRYVLHPDHLLVAQQRCKLRETAGEANLFSTFSPPPTDMMVSAEGTPDVWWAEDYFVACWMGHGGRAGTASEFDGGMSFRWDAGGGSSGVRFRNGVISLPAWRKTLKRCDFVCRDMFEFVDEVKDEDGIGLYIDDTWPDAGELYKHKITYEQHQKVRDRVARFKRARVVIRYGDHELIRALYPESQYTWLRQKSRTQQNKALDEVLILNGPAYAAEGTAKPRARRSA